MSSRATRTLRPSWLAPSLTALLLACSGSERGDPTSTGNGADAGKPGTGTQGGSGGAAGGSTSTGGASTDGGTAPWGGTAGEAALAGTAGVGTGGAVGGDGGSWDTGGVSTTGGSTNTGGTTSTGGATNTGGTTSTGGSGGSGPAPCPAGATITATDSNAGYARYGSVFATAYYSGSNLQPKPLEVTVLSDGKPVNGCEVTWNTAARNGWAFGERKTTNAAGKVRAFWTAGDLPSQTATANIALSGGGTATAQFNGAAQPSQTRGNSVHLWFHASGVWNEYKMRVQPMSGPAATYYETIGWSGAYGGIQFDPPATKVLFSVWDTNGIKSKFISKGACNDTPGFGGEGTGTSCRLLLPPSKYGAIPGLPNDYMLKVGDVYETHLKVTDCGANCTDYTFEFTDVTRGIGPISLGTQRWGDDAADTDGNAFIENWYDPAGQNCISAGERTAYFEPQAKTAKGWEKLKTVDFSPNYLPNNNEVCTNYHASVEGSRILMSSGGSKYVSRPVLPGAPFFNSGWVLAIP